MNGDIKLSAPGGLPGDIWLDTRNPAFANYTFVGRVVATDGSARVGVTITVFERRSLTTDVRLVSGTTDARGGYRVDFSLPDASGDWDVFIRAEDSSTAESVDSALIYGVEAGTHTVDLILGAGSYQGRSEYDRIAAKVEALLGSTQAKDVPADRLEWLCKRADVFPLHLAMWVQAHRLADGRTVKPESCYAFLRAGLPSDLPGLLRAGEAAWESALRNAWMRRTTATPGTGTTTERDTEVASQIAAMRELVVDAAVSTTGTTQRAFLDALDLSETEQRAFTQMWLDHTGTLDEFWQDVRDSVTLGTAKAADLQFAIQGGLLVDHSVSALEGLAAERAALNISTIADTAAWDYGTWDAFLVTRSVTPPDHVPGADPTEKRQNYARALERASEDAFPTLTLRHRINQDASPPPNTAELVAFLDANSGFDIVHTNIERWVADNPAAFSGATDPIVARENLEIMQRIYRLAPRIGRYSTAKTLLQNNIRSAADVSGYTRDEFVSTFSTLFDGVHHTPNALAGRVWDQASRIHGSARAMASYLGLAKTRADFRPLSGIADWDFENAGNGLDGLASILGDLDYCACEHCRSVFSPAAYLADLLHFLVSRPAVSGTGLSVLSERRPDIEHILLDCENTNTPLPYIDLVNECLERVLKGSLDASSLQTTWTAEELRLHPEHLDAAVYEGTVVGLAQQITELVHPWVLPFFLPDIEAREMMAFLGVPRHELMSLLVDDAPVSPTAEEIAAEQLGLSPLEHDIIAGAYTGNTSTDDREFYGFIDDVSTDNWVNILNGFDDPAGDIGELLSRGAFTLDELRDVLSLTFIDPNHYNPGTRLEFVWMETCSLADAKISNLDAQVLDRLHRFTRLQRRLMVPARMLNVLIDDYGNGSLDAGLLSELANIVTLEQRFGIAWDELASWWSTRIDARVYESGAKSLYQRRFLPPGAEAPAGFVPTSDRGDALPGDQLPAQITASDLPTILAAVRLSEDDYNRLLATTSLTIDDAFTLANLTRIFAASSLARAVKLSIPDFIGFLELSGLNPFANPTATLDFVDAVDTLRNSRIELAELDWLLRDVGEPTIDRDTMSRDLVALSRGLATIESEVGLLVDPTGEAVKANLTSVVTDIDVAMAIVDGSSTDDDPTQTAFIEANFASFVDPAVAVAQLVTDGGALGDNLVDRYTWVLQTFTSQRRKRALLIDAVVSAFGVSASVADTLLYSLLTQPATSTRVADTFAASFITEAELAAGANEANHGVDESTHPDQFVGWLRLAKAAIFAVRHQVTAAQLGFYSNGASGNWLDLNALPLTDSDPDAGFASWRRLVAALALRSMFGDAELGHSELANAATFTAALERLSELTNWPFNDLNFFANSVGWSTTAVFADELALERMRGAISARDSSGVSIAVLWSWVHDSMTLTKSGQIKAAARAKAGEDHWPAVAKPIRDRLRAQQRDALVAAIIALGLGESSEQLIDWLLLDVEMSPCMMTTRTLQAISSVQMLVHRILLQLEAQKITFSEGAAAAWDWMKNYRVWEANRKVFLYPENWIEPELRTDRTPQFDQLESTLMQDTLEDRKIESAVASYLTGLDCIAKLEAVAIYRQTRASTLWLLARTQSAPRSWYLRSRTSHGTWSPWEELPLQIDSDNVLLFERRGRVLLFWLTTILAEEQNSDDEQVKATKFAITWAERDHQGWSQTTMSDQSRAVRTADPATPDKFLLRAWLLSDSIPITVYRELDAGDIQPCASFRYDTVSRHVMFCGTDISHEAFPEYLNSSDCLTDPGLIGLQPDYVLEGQRFVKRQLNSGSVPQAPMDTLVYPTNSGNYDSGNYDPGTSFVQAYYSEDLFYRAPNTGYRTLLHQGDFWEESEFSPGYPVVYDDRQRKYLLEPIDGAPASEAGVAADNTSPSYVGGSVYPYYGCTEASEVTTLRPRVPIEAGQTWRDGLKTKTTWADGIPGSIAAPDSIVAIVGGSLSPSFGNNLLAQGNQVMGANENVGGISSGLPQSSDVRLRMTCLYHPFAREMLETVAERGLLALYRPTFDDDLFRQEVVLEPLTTSGLDLNEGVLAGKAPVEEYDFAFASPYGLYNWEVFYHIPMLIAKKLSDEQRFADAQRWFHTMFDPIETVSLPGETEASKFWRIRPFVDQAQKLAKNQFETMLGINATPQEQEQAIKNFEEEVAEWRNNPFDPHAIARVRPGVYQRALLKAYFDNLIAWADHLFRQDTFESINEATILYVLVAQLLGPRPQEVPSGAEAESKSFAQLQAEGLDAFSNVAQKLENWIVVPATDAESLGCSGDVQAPWVPQKVEIRFWYFCYPPNPQLLAYWDTIEDRLWKIRHCQNIDGIERTLALFQPPIDPGLLVRAAAAGVDLSSVLAELDSGLPPYRFRSVLARADGFCSDLRALGSALLQAIEKRDSEALARIRSEHELAVLAAVREVRRRQVEEAKAGLSSLQAAKATIEQRLAHYEELVATDINSEEKAALNLSLSSAAFRSMSQSIIALGGILELIPNFTVEVGISPSVGTIWGGRNIGGAVAAAGNALGVVPTTLDGVAAWIATKAQYARRKQDWDFQVKQARSELARMDRDLIAAEIRVAIAERELANHDLSVAHSREVDQFMREKFTNRELYDWMIGQLSALYFQTYQIAFDLAKRAERAFRHELAIRESDPIIKYGYWDSLRKGLLAGERLAHDLKRLDLAYMDKDVREFELRKSISLAQIDPLALRSLQESGECTFHLLEALFDLDHPGHYLRRIKGVRLTIPAVVGPYTSLGVRLELDTHKTRVTTDVVVSPNNYAEGAVSPEDRFRYGYGRGEAIATSTAAADGGVFNLDFRDERYLPFEYAGAVSSWKLALPNDVRQFDYRTISDVVIHLDYTARDGGTDLRSAAQSSVVSQLNAALEGQELMQVIVVNDAFPNEWEQFLSPDAQATDQTLTLPVTETHFPYLAQRQGFDITQVDFALLLDESVASVTAFNTTLNMSGANPALTPSFDDDPANASAPYVIADTGTLTSTEQPGAWTLTLAQANVPTELEDLQDGWLDRTKVTGMVILVRYTLQ